MADREARVRLTLQNGSFLNGIGEAKRSGEGLTSGLSRGFASFGSSAMGTISRLGSQVKGLLSMTLGLAGAFSVGDAVRHAMDLEGKFKNIAFAVKAGTGVTMDYRAEMENAHAIAKKWGQSTEDIADSFKRLFEDTGNLEFTKSAMGEIAKAATASGESMETLTRVSGELNEKFGVTSKELPQALAAVISLGNQGGLTVEEMSEKVGALGASAKLLGIHGTDGFQKVVGIANIAEGSTKNVRKAIASTAGLLDQMASKDFGKTVEKQLGIKVTDKGGKVGADALEKIIGKTHGKQELLAKVFTGDQLKVVSDLGKVYADAMNATTGTAKQKAEAGAKALSDAMLKAGKSMLTAQQVTDQANERAKSTAKRVKEAQETFYEAFNKPEMTAAINKLAQELPQLASAAAKVVSFFVENPFAGIGAVVSGAIVKDIAAAKLGEVIKGLLTGGGGGGGGAPVPGGRGPGGAGGALAAAAAAAAIAEAEDQAASLQRETGMKTNVLDFAVPGMKGGKFSGWQLLKDMTPGLGQYEAFSKSTEAGGELGTKMAGKEMRRGAGFGAFAAHVEAGRAAPMTPMEAQSADLKGAASDQKSAAQKQADSAAKMLSAATSLERAASKLSAGAGGNGLPPPAGNSPGFVPR